MLCICITFHQTETPTSLCYVPVMFLSKPVALKPLCYVPVMFLSQTVALKSLCYVPVMFLSQTVALKSLCYVPVTFLSQTVALKSLCYVPVTFLSQKEALKPLCYVPVTFLSQKEALKSMCYVPVKFPSHRETPSSGSGFFLACQDFGRMFDNLFPACTYLFIYFKVKISSRTLIPLLRPRSVHSGSASWDDCDWVFPDEFCMSSFPNRFPHYACTAA